MSEGERELPQGWGILTIGEASIVNPPGKTVSPEDDTLVSFLPMAAVEALSGVIDASEHREFSKVKKGFTRFKEGDLLFAKITPSMENGKIAIARGLKNGLGCGTTEFHVLRAGPTTNINYLRYFVLRDWFRGQAKRKMAGAVGQQRVPKSFLESYPLPLPSLAEQGRIVDKIDELFSSIEAGERAIEQARAGVARYRKAVLKAAVTGELTRDWRDDNPPQVSAEGLLTRILKARFAAWEKAELAKLDAKGKAHPETDKQWEKIRARYKPPVEPDTKGLPDLPRGWREVTVDQISEFITSGSRGWAKYYSNEGPLFVRVGNFNRSSIELDFKKLQCVSPPDGAEGARTKLQSNDLLVSITADVGMVAIFRDQYEDAYINQHVALVRTPSETNEEWLAWAIVNPTKQQEILGTGRGATKDGLTLSDLRELIIPFPPAAEQAEIVSRVEEALSKADAAEATLDAQARAARALKQAVLKTAFEGKLVPQNPKDEPAIELLKRIKEET